MSRPKLLFLLIVGILSVLIVFRYYNLESRIRNQELGINPEEEITIEGKIVKEPDVRADNVKLVVESGGMRILATVPKYPEYGHKDKVRLTGKLQIPSEINGFDYKKYLNKDGIAALSYSPQVELIARGPTSGNLWFKNKLRASMENSLPYSQGNILEALILGDKNKIEPGLKEKFNRAGISHIVAISGMNIVLLVSYLTPLFLFLGFWKRQAGILCLVFIAVYIIFTGLEASSVRAGIMGSLALIAPLFGRSSNSLRLIGLAAAIMLLINPFYLFYDVGFQLSFLATLGIIYLSPLLHKIKSETVVSTISAYIFTAPILIYSFGQISLVGLLVNILVLPVIVPIMILGLISSSIGVLWLGLGQVLSWPVWFLITYIIKVSELFSGDWGVQMFKQIHWLWLLAYYLPLIFFCHYLYKKEKSIPYFLR